MKIKKIKGTRDDDGMSPDYNTKSWLYGLGGDDTFYFRDYARDDRFYGGGGDDRVYGVEATLPAKIVSFKNGFFFDGGPGFDTVEMELRVDRSDATVPLKALYGTLRRVEKVEVEIELDAQNSRPLDDALVRGTKRADLIELFLDDGTSATDLRIKTGAGADVVRVSDGGFVGTKIVLGAGKDTYFGEDNRFIAKDGDSAVIKGNGGADRFYLGWGQETAIGGAGQDTFFTSSSDTTDTLRGGKGADHFVFSTGGVAYGAQAHRIHVADFKSGTDKVVVVSNTFQPLDGPTALVLDKAFGEGGSGFTYDRASGALSYFDTVVATFGEGRKLAFGDVVMVNDYDDMFA